MIFRVNGINFILIIFYLKVSEVGLYGIGTARTDRKDFPEQLKKTKLKNRYEFKCVNKKYLIIL